MRRNRGRFCVVERGDPWGRTWWFTLRVFFDGKTEFTEAGAEREVFAVGVGDEAGGGKIEAAFFIKIAGIDIGAEDLAYEHVMAAELKYLRDPAFQTDRAFGYAGSLYHFRGLLCKLKIPLQGKLVDITAGLYPCEIYGFHHVFSGQADGEFTGPFDDGVGKALLPYGNGEHDGIRADGAGPGGGHDVGAAVLILAAYKHGGNGVEHVGGLPGFFFDRHWRLLSYISVPSIFAEDRMPVKKVKP